MVFEAHGMSIPCTELLLFNCKGKYSFPFYVTFKERILNQLKIKGFSFLKKRCNIHL